MIYLIYIALIMVEKRTEKKIHILLHLQRNKKKNSSLSSNFIIKVVTLSNFYDNIFYMIFKRIKAI